MISEGSCDTEDWSNDAENLALHHVNKLHFKMHKLQEVSSEKSLSSMWAQTFGLIFCIK